MLCHLEMFSLLVLLKDLGPLGLKVTHVAGELLPLVHGLPVVPQAALLRRLIVTLVTGKGDPGMLGQFVHLEGAGLCGPEDALVAGESNPLVDGTLVFAQVALFQGLILALVAGKALPLVNGTLVISEIAHLGRLVVTLITGESDT